jgi:seryl-tRNA synthetase
MKFEMEVQLLCSDVIKDKEVVDKALGGVKALLQKGAPEGKGARVTSHSVEGDTVSLELVSGRYVRPHDAILRINKYLSVELGKSLQIGIRDIKVKRYEVWYELKQKPLEEIRLPFTERIEIRGNVAHIILKDIDQEALENKYVDRLLKRLEEKISQQHIAGKAEYVEEVKKSGARLQKYKMPEDPTQELVKRGWVHHSGTGVWTILPPYTALMRAIEEVVIERVAKPLGFQEAFFPKIITLDIQKKKGQLGGIPNEIWWVCPPKSRDPAQWEEYSDYVKITGKNAPEMLFKNLGKPIFSLAYAQCEPFYDIWEGKVIDRDKLPIKFLDRYGPTWRYEAGGLKGLERLTEFKRMEFTWLSSPEEVIEIRDRVMDKSLEVIDKIFDLEWRLDATTAIYLEHAGEKVEKEEREYVRTYDLTVLLPFETVSRPEKELEIASFHVHEDFYARNFHWKEKKDRPLWSGCAGVSPTRWAYVFILRHGLNFEDWPMEIRKYIGDKLPELPGDLFM